jgi:hypothetical protein
MPVDRSYADRSPFAFTGTVKKVVFDTNPHLTEEDDQDLRARPPSARRARDQRAPEPVASGGRFAGQRHLLGVMAA